MEFLTHPGNAPTGPFIVTHRCSKDGDSHRKKRWSTHTNEKTAPLSQAPDLSGNGPRGQKEFRYVPLPSNPRLEKTGI